MIINRIAERYEQKVMLGLSDITKQVVNRCGLYVDCIDDEVFVPSVTEQLLMRKLRIAQQLADMLQEYPYAEIINILDVLRDIQDELENADVL